MKRIIWSVLVGMALVVGAGCHSEDAKSGNCACSHSGASACTCGHCKGSTATCSCPK